MSTATEKLESVDIVRLLADLITGNGLAAGDRLPSIRELAGQFGVKTGTVRDALLTSQARELVKILPRVGAIVQGESESEDIGDAAAMNVTATIPARRKADSFWTRAEAGRRVVAKGR